jgi:type IV secretory pathway component VirB8
MSETLQNPPSEDRPVSSEPAAAKPWADTLAHALVRAVQAPGRREIARIAMIVFVVTIAAAIVLAIVVILAG